MKREILFRAQRVDNKAWVEGDLIHGVGYEKGNMFILPIKQNLAYLEGCHPLNGYQVIPESVCQFTGLTDKNGTNIFEGDIVNNSKVVCNIIDNGCSFENYAEFCSGHYVENKKFVARIDFDFENELLYESENTSCEHFNEEYELFGFIAGFEVIGNIFDSPELLK